MGQHTQKHTHVHTHTNLILRPSASIRLTYICCFIRAEYLGLCVYERVQIQAETLKTHLI